MSDEKQDKQLVRIEDDAMSPDAITHQVQLIQQVMQRVMKQDEHYGKIPGTDKPTLLKPGAEKLCLTFRLNPDYEIIREVREEKFLAYTVKCTLHHITTERAVASGIGSCNSREEKYRWHHAWEVSDKPVPKDYWKHRDSSLIGGKDFRPIKIDGKWVIAKRGEKEENLNPWDLDNTLIKMACKRALVAAVLNGTAASDIFTQDLEDAVAESVNKPKTEEGIPSGEYPDEASAAAGTPPTEKSSIEPTPEHIAELAQIVESPYVLEFERYMLNAMLGKKISDKYVVSKIEYWTKETTNRTAMDEENPTKCAKYMEKTEVDLRKKYPKEYDEFKQK